MRSQQKGQAKRGFQQKSVWDAIDRYDVRYFEEAVRGRYCIPNVDRGGKDLLTYAIEARFSDAVLAICACGAKVMQHHVQTACAAFEEDEYAFFPKPRKLLEDHKSIIAKGLKSDVKKDLYLGNDEKFLKTKPTKEQAEKATFLRFDVETLRFLLATMKISEVDNGWDRLPPGLRNKRIQEYNRQFDPFTRYYGLGKKDFLFFCISNEYVACVRMMCILYPPKANVVVFAVRDYAKNVGNAIKIGAARYERTLLHGRLPENLFETEEDKAKLLGPMQKVLNSLEVVSVVSKYAGQDQINGSWEGSTPMLAAVETRSSILVERLIKRGAYLNFVPEGATKLPLTAVRDSDLAGLLILNGANPDMVDKDGDNMLSASLRGYAQTKEQKMLQRLFEMIRASVDAKPNPDFPEDNLPIILAIKTDSPLVFDIVLSAGPNPDPGIFWARDNGKKAVLDKLMEYKRRYDMSLDDLVQKLESSQRTLSDMDRDIQEAYSGAESAAEGEKEAIFADIGDLKKRRAALRRETESYSNILRLFLVRSQMSFSDNDLSRPRGIANCLNIMGANRDKVNYERIRDKRAELRIQRYSESVQFDSRTLPDGTDAGEYSDDQLAFFWQDSKPYVIGTWDIPSIINGDKKNPFTGQEMQNSLLERLGSHRLATKTPGLQKELDFLFSRELMGAQTLISFRQEEEPLIVGEEEFEESDEEEEDVLDAAIVALKDLKL